MSCFPALLRRSYPYLVLIVCLLQGCASGKRPLQETQATPKNQYEEFARALSSANADSSTAEFDRYFKTTGSITLDGADVLHLNRFMVARDGAIYVCDFERKSVVKFDADAKNKIIIGATGNEPGKHLFPTAVVEAKDSSIAVPDFQGYRVNIFSSGGEFRSSFIFTPQNFSAQQLMFNATNDSFYLFGNRWQYDADGKLIGADMIHKYSSGGEYAGSYLDFPDKFKSLDLYNNSFPMTDIVEGTIYAILPFDYTVYRLSRDDKIDVFLRGDKKDFREPQSKLDTQKAPRSEGYELGQTWNLTYTPIVALVGIGDKLMVQYQTFNPTRYTVDIWSIPSKKLQGSFKTNRLLLGRGDGNSLYFLNNIEPRMQDKYVISKAEAN